MAQVGSAANFKHQLQAVSCRQRRIQEKPFGAFELTLATRESAKDVIGQLGNRDVWLSRGPGSTDQRYGCVLAP